MIGGGIIGLTIAREAKLRWPDQSVTLIEKEFRVASHASGRNSGVLHAGFYYTPDSMKARLTHTGNLEMQRFCDQNGVAVNRCGKLVVASSPDDLPVLNDLYSRGISNGVPLELVDSKTAKQIEPRAATYQNAIFSPDTSSVDPVEVCDKMESECARIGVAISTGEAFTGGKEGPQSVTIRTSKRVLAAGFVINAAGLYADKIAQTFGLAHNYQMQPFKGLYLHADKSFGALRTHIYPVPDMRNPFLGVHFTIASNGSIKIGPTATPALWREQYGGWNNFTLAELIETMAGLAALLAAPGSSIRRSAPSEMAKYLRPLLVRQASRLVPEVNSKQFTKWGTPGIRAQLFDKTTKTLVSDFKIESSGRTLHILNAVSPAFTSSLPFSSLAVDMLSKLSP